MKGKLVILTVIGVLVALPLLAACAAPTPTPTPTPAEEVYEWEFTSWAPRGTFPCDEIDKHFVDTIEAMSGGRLTIKFHGVGELMEPDEIFGATKAGVVDLATSCGYHVGELPVNEIEYAFPMGLPKLEEQWILWYDRGLYEFMRDEVYLQHNLWLLPPQILVSVPIMISSKEVTTLADISGMKVRAYGSHATMLEKYGATVVWVPFAELYTALATGVIDGAGCPSISEMVDLKLYEVAKYLVLPMQEPWVASSVFVNLDSWNALPDDLKAIVNIAAMESSMSATRVYMRLDQAGVGEMEAQGVTFVQLPPEDVATIYETASEVWDELEAKGPDFAEVIRLVKEYMEFLGYL